MIGIENKDSSFFTVESPDITLEDQDFSKDLISLSMTEKTSMMPQGTLQFYDPNHYYSRILRTGARLLISWGYRNLFTTPDSLIAKQLNFDEVTGQLIRRGYEGFVSSPTGGGSRDGVVTYNCNFTAFGFRGEDASKIYLSGTKASVIAQAFDDLGISPIKRLIDFSLGNDKVTSDYYIRQDETTYAFLNRLAIEWRAMFHIAFSPSGESVGMFIDEAMIGNVQWPTWVLNATGTSNILGYKGKLNNVISYTWSSSESERGVGDNVQLDIVDGQIIFRRYVAEEEKVITYRLDEQKIQDVYAQESNRGLGQQIKLTKELLSKNDFEQIKHFFTPVESSTAPTGYGYKINAEMIGNPLYIPGSLMKINNGFPDRLGGSQSKWYLQGVTHKIDRSGYFMSIEVVDVFFLSPIGQPVR
jgi:hypothetical protein